MERLKPVDRRKAAARPAEEAGQQKPPSPKEVAALKYAETNGPALESIAKARSAEEIAAGLKGVDMGKVTDAQAAVIRRQIDRVPPSALRTEMLKSIVNGVGPEKGMGKNDLAFESDEAMDLYMMAKDEVLSAKAPAPRNAAMEGAMKAEIPHQFLPFAVELAKRIDTVDVRAIKKQILAARDYSGPRTKVEFAAVQSLVDRLQEVTKDDTQALRSKGGDVVPASFEGRRTVVPATKPPEKRTDPGIFDRLMRNARKSLGL